MSFDEGIRATNDDASSCKAQAVYRGYWQDSYIQYFIKSGERKAPEINRGYYARVKGVQTLIEQFMELHQCKCQIINLGAGFDTCYWTLKENGLQAVNFVEVDFEAVVRKKCHYVKSRKKLLDQLDNPAITATSIHSENYHAMSVDLRDVCATSASLTEHCNIDSSLPTLVLAECVLVYMPAACSANLLSWFAATFPVAMFVNYEMINMKDRFGQIMVKNLVTRGCSLDGIEHCESLESQKNRFINTGWTSAEAWDMVTVYNALPRNELDRIEKLEFLDDIEIFENLLSHYHISLAYHDTRHPLVVTGGADEDTKSPLQLVHIRPTGSIPYYRQPKIEES